MSFLAPLFLIGLATLALPLWLHRRRRPTAEREVVPSLMLFERDPRRSAERKRIIRRILLSLRFALLALLVAAFARPIWQRMPSAVRVPSRLDVIAVDTSLSMALGDRLARARAQAYALLDASLAESAQVVVVEAAHTARMLAGPTAERETLQGAIASLRARHSRLAYGAFAREVSAVLDRARAALGAAMDGDAVDVRVHMISDFQRTGAPSQASTLLEAPVPGLRLHAIAGDVPATAIPNWSIESATADVVDAGTRRISAVVRGFDTPEATRTLRLRLEGEVLLEQARTVPASGRATFVFEDVRPPAGASRVALELVESDALPADDTHRLAVEVRPPRRILFASPEPAGRAALYYGAAMRAAGKGELLVESVPLARLTDAELDGYPLIVVAGAEALSERAAQRLTARAQAGGALLLALGGPATRGRAKALPVTGHELLPDSLATGANALTQSLIDVAAPTHPVLSSAARWDDVHVFRHIRIAPRQSDDVLLRVGSQNAVQDPLLLEHRLGEGRVLILATALDASTSDLPLRPLFVPFVRSSARYLIDARLPATATIVDSPLAIGAEPTQVYDESGARLLSLAESGGAGTRTAVTLDQLGFYRLMRGGETYYVAVNPDPRESDPTPMSAGLRAAWEDTARVLTDAPQRGPLAAATPDAPITPLWPYLLLAALFIALAEALVANRALGAPPSPRA
jgi:hypothetical protein